MGHPLISLLLEFQHRRLKEAVMAGFKGAKRQVLFVRILTTVCKVLQNVVLLKRGHFRDKGLWD